MRIPVLIACLALLALPAWAETRLPRDRTEIQLSFAPLVAKTSPSVVNVYATRVERSASRPFAKDPLFSRFFGDVPGLGRTERALGSGVIVSSDGVVVTNNHVVGNASAIRVVLPDRREFDATVLLSDPAADLAVIRIRAKTPLPALPLGDADALAVGDLVLAIGNPFGIGQTVTSGIVSALARETGTAERSAYRIQTDAPINPGNSGGALIDMGGRLVGINTAILSRSGGSNGIGFAIPVNLVRQYIAQARAGQTRFQAPWAGIRVQAIDADLAAALGQAVPEGVMVSAVHPSSPFAEAGLSQGDVLLTFDDAPLSAPAALAYRMATRGLSGEARVRFTHQGKARLGTVRLGPAPDIPPAERVEIAARGPLRGLVAANANPRLIETLSLPLETEGVIVLATDGPATRIGLRRGDRLLQINGQSIDTPATLKAVAMRRSRFWEIEILRDGHRLRVRFDG